MAVSMSSTMQSMGMVAAFVAELFERWDCRLQPKDLSLQHDHYHFKDVVILTFDAFSVQVDLPDHHLVSLGDVKSVFDRFIQSFQKARTYFPSDTLHHLNSRSGFHDVAMVGGYSHGGIMRMNLSKPVVRVAAVDAANSPFTLVKEEEPIPDPSLTTILYELAYFEGDGIPAYILHPSGEVPSEEFIRMTFKEFPLLGLLPASQGLIYTPTAFICDGAIYQPLRGS